MGRFLFNEIIPQDLGFVDRSKPENFLELEINFTVGKKQLKPILEKCINIHGATQTAELLDAIKALGYKYATQAAFTVSISDMKVPEEKKDIIAEAEKTIEEITKEYKRGRMTEEERYNTVIETWKEADQKLTDMLLAGMDSFNNIKMMSDSVPWFRQADQTACRYARIDGGYIGTYNELPIKSNLREGLDVLEYFISPTGEKGLSTALRMADSGYLTRRLVDVAQDLIIREVDCREHDEEIPAFG